MNDRPNLSSDERLCAPALGDGTPAPISAYEPVPDQGPIFDPFDRVPHFRIIAVVVLLIVAFVSAIPLSSHFSSPETYAGTIQTLDSKRDTVLGLTAASAGISAAVSAIPGDAGTPIAEKLMDLSSDFLIVLAAIYLEKFLLTTLGFASFGILFPVACALTALYVLLRGRAQSSFLFARLAKKVLLFGIVLAVTVPASVFITNKIEGTYQQSIQNTIDTANDAAAEAEKADEDGEGSEDLLGWIQAIPENVMNGLSGAADGARNLVNNFIDALAVMLVTSCVIPILVLLFFLWAAKLVLGINIDAPMRWIRPRTLRNVNRGTAHK